jgi:hypothetical protein
MVPCTGESPPAGQVINLREGEQLQRERKK